MHIDILCPGCDYMLLRETNRIFKCVNIHCEYYNRRFKVSEIPIELILEPKEDVNADSRDADTTGAPGGAADA